MRISDWSSDVCSSDLGERGGQVVAVTCSPAVMGAVARPMGQPNFRTGSPAATARSARSEERRVGKSVSVRVDLGGRRIIKKKRKNTHNNNLCMDQQDNEIKSHINPDVKQPEQ